jgi:hypothetical protein
LNYYSVSSSPLLLFSVSPLLLFLLPARIANYNNCTHSFVRLYFMKTKTVILKNFLSMSAVLGVLLLTSANSIFAQCGNYFKPNYLAVTQLGGGYLEQPLLDDWTGDGKSDFWTFRTNPNTSKLDVVIYPAKPTGYWDWNNPVIYTTTISEYNAVIHEVLDIDSDGRKDLAFGVGGNFQILRNAGNGSLTLLPTLTDADGQTGFTSTFGFADVNSDNLLDWIYTLRTNSADEIRYQLQSANGTFGSKTTVLVSSSQNFFNVSASKKLGDFNGDGRADIIYFTFSGSLNSYVNVTLRNLGNGSFQTGAPAANDLYFASGAGRGKFTDFNNDGKEDILGGNRLFYGQADGSFVRVEFPFVSYMTAIPAELNGDNYLDFIETDNSSYYAAHINNGAGGFTRNLLQGYSGTKFPDKLEDFSGDGKADVYETRPAGQETYNIFGERLISIKVNVCQRFGETKMGVFDGGGADLTTWNANTGNWSSKKARWGFAIDPNMRVFNWGLGSHGDVPAPGDFDGDGRTDYSVYRDSTGTWYIRQSSNEAWLVFRFGLAGDIAVPNDYDGGGKTDIAVFRPSDGNWYIWFSETQSFTALHFGAAGDKAVPADYDGDGKTDVAVYRPSTGNWYYLRSSDGNFAVYHWGIDTDKPVPADYDGDGRADLAIYRGGTWWILRSSNNSANAIPFGTASDIPVPIYRNSVSADLTFYRPSNNTWSSFDNRFFIGTTVGGAGDVPVYFGLPNN